MIRPFALFVIAFLEVAKPCRTQIETKKEKTPVYAKQATLQGKGNPSTTTPRNELHAKQTNSLPRKNTPSKHNSWPKLKASSTPSTSNYHS
jgi:hypothetical protein